MILAFNLIFLLFQQVITFSPYHFDDINRKHWIKPAIDKSSQQDLNAAYADQVPKVSQIKKIKIVKKEEYEQATPYNFGYDIKDDLGNRQYRTEQSDGKGTVRGSYGYTDANGLYRIVDYIADEHGFRARVRSNEPGLAFPNSSGSSLNDKLLSKTLTSQQPEIQSFQKPVIDKPSKIVSTSNLYPSIQSSSATPTTIKPTISKPYKIVRVANIYPSGQITSTLHLTPKSVSNNISELISSYNQTFKMNQKDQYTHILNPRKPKSVLGNFTVVTLATPTEKSSLK